MDDRQELQDLRRLAELESKAVGNNSSEADDPSYLAVAGNAAAKGVAGMIDMFGNAPTNAFNLGQGVIGATAEALGHPEVWADRTYGTPPNLGQKGMTALGLIKPENEPQTAGQRILDMAIQTGVGVAASPASGVMGVVKNAALGATSGALAGVTKEATGSELAATAVGIAVPLIARGIPSKANAPTLKNPVKRTTLQEAQAEGLVVIPSQVKPSFSTNRIEGIGGKAAIKQQVQTANVEKIDALAKRAIGLPSDVPITKESLAQLKEVASKPYQEVNQLSQVPLNTPGVPSFPQYAQRNLLEELKQARHDATAHFTFYNRNLDPKVLRQAQGFRVQAETIETQLAQVARQAGSPELVEQLKAGRQLYARISDVERATNFADGHVDPTVFAALFRKGKPLSGELKVIGKFAAAYPDAVRQAARIQSPGVSGTEAGMSAILGMGGAAAAGPVGLLAGGLPLLRGPARSMLLSKGYQSRLLKSPPALNQALLKSVLAGRSVAESP